MEVTITYPHTTSDVFIPANPLLTPFDPFTFLFNEHRVEQRESDAHDQAKNWILLSKSERENGSKIESFIAYKDKREP